MSATIPQPRRIPFIGNVTSLDKELPLRSFILLAQQYGDLYQLDIIGRKVIHVCTYALANEVSNDAKFLKAISPPLRQVRSLAGDGLFTAENDDPNWGLAHRLLMPAFGTAAIRGMFDDMCDICNQMLVKWERFGSSNIVDPTDDFTRVALDTLAFCTMSYRLNSFYYESPPAFGQAMASVLKESFARSTRLPVVQALKSSSNAKYQEEIDFMSNLAEQIVAERHAHPTDKKDLLNIMLSAKDSKTGQGLPEKNIIYNLLTFLIAGHETSSGTLSFVVYYLLKNPEAMRKLRAEIDSVVGDRPIQYEDLSKLHYLIAVMRETLRLSPTAPVRTVSALQDTVLGGKYSIKAGQFITLQAYCIHRDPLVWGEDAAEWKPERMLDGKFEALPPNAWQPFGYGARGCIGRPFAWQEIQLVLASIFQRFDVSLADPSYTLQLQQALTIKPKGFYIRATPRNTPRLYAAPSGPWRHEVSNDAPTSSPVPSPSGTQGTKPVYILYGSNTGTSESFAQRVATDAASHGFHATIGTLDSAVNNLPKDGPILIITASFEGQPADNAVSFIDWLTHLSGEELAGISFAVFGCGNQDWVQTYQRIPTICDDLLEKRGGKRLLVRGAGNAAEADFFQVFDDFEAKFWDTLSKVYSISSNGSAPSFEVKTLDAGSERAATLRQPDAALGSVVENRVLTSPGVPIKRHIEFELPEGFTFRSGDYLAILPHNPPTVVHRVLAHFGLSQEQQVIISSVGPTSLPVGKPVNLSKILSGYVELSQPATTRDLRALVEASSSDITTSTLTGLITKYTEKVLGGRISVLDLLELYPDIKLSLSAFLLLLPPMRVRQYSISSSPLFNPQHVTLTVSVLSAPARSDDTRSFLGVGSNYLASLVPGDRVQMSVRPSAVAFHPPADPAVPLIMFCAGSGLAPMRGFIQERAVQKESGRNVGPALLFFGCRGPADDYLYADSDLARWVKLGVVDVRPAFSKSPANSKDCKYIQDRVWHDREDVVQAYRAGAKLFACGSGAIAKEVKQKLIAIIQANDGIDEIQAAAKFDVLVEGRFATDVFD
ncbi:hypothetical protein HGRIS_009796 [Hohenbuehelia grisea]|uniref:Cytochrome P450 n=1 Tax=Hohenbuehelia grisea TaxID=104357 RepID=A0ABR3J2C6_9AGAR